MMITRLWSIAAIALALLIGPGPVFAEPAASVVSHEQLVRIQKARMCPLPAGTAIGDDCPEEAVPASNKHVSTCPVSQKRSVQVNETIETCKPGRLRVRLLSEYGPERSFQIDSRTRVVVLGPRETPSLNLIVGALHWFGPNGKILTDLADIKGIHTEFIVTHETGGVTEVVAVNGEVNVETKVGRSIVLQGDGETGDRVRVYPKIAPEIVRGEKVEPFLGRFDFVGGGHAQSLALDNSILTGEFVPHLERAPLPLRRWDDEERIWPEQPIFFDVVAHF